MKTRKAFLAKVLAAAVAITSLLPGGAMTANAANVQLFSEGWKVQKVPAKVDTNWEWKWDDEFEDELNLNGIQTWHIQSSDADGNEHVNFASPSAPAAVYAADIDITAPEEEADHRVIRFDMMPIHQDGDTGSTSTASKMRFGVMLKYVDSTHWVMLGSQLGNNWFLQWNDGTYVDDTSNYQTIAEFSGDNAFVLEDDKFHRVEIEYLSSSQIKVSLQKMKKVSDTEWTVTGDPVSKVLDHESIYKVKEYATTSQAPGSKKEIYFGFKAGTFGSTKTNVDIANVQTNANEEGTMQSLRYGYCGWTAIKPGRDYKEILSVNSVGGVNYVSIDAATSESPKTISYTNEDLNDFGEGTTSAVLRPYGEEVGTNVEKEFYFNVRTATSQSPDKSLNEIQVGYNGQKWGYKIGNEFVEAKTDVAGPKTRHDYRVDVSFTKDNKFSASVVEVTPFGDEDALNGGDAYTKGDFSKEVEGTKIQIADQVDLSEKNVPKAGSISIPAGAGLKLRVRNVNYAKARYENAIEYLGNAYTTVMNRNNANNTYYSAAWDKFAAARATADMTLRGPSVMTSGAADGFLKDMQDAWAELDVDDNKIAVDKALLETAKIEIEAYIADKDNYNYGEEALTDQLNTVLTEVSGLITKINNTPAELTKAEVTTALGNWDTKKAKVTPKPADETDKQNIEAALAEANKYKAEDAKYYDNWEAFEAALSEVKRLQNAEGATKLEIKEALDALKDAMNALTLKAATSEEKSAFENAVNAIKGEVNGKLQPDAAYTAALDEAEKLLASGNASKKALDEALAKLQAAKGALKPIQPLTPPPAGSNDPAVGSSYTDQATKTTYTVKANQTVELKTGNKTAKNVTVNTVKINDKEYKVVSIAANAFKNAKMTKLTIGDNVKTINKNAFNNCNKMTTLTIGKNVTSIKANAFAKCKKLKNITFKGTKKLPSMKNAFKNANKKPSKIQVKKALVKTSKKKKAILKQLKAAGFKKITAKNIKGK